MPSPFQSMENVSYFNGFVKMSTTLSCDLIEMSTISMSFTCSQNGMIACVNMLAPFAEDLILCKYNCRFIVNADLDRFLIEYSL